MPDIIPFMRVSDPSNPGQCCPCNKQTGCNCEGAACGLHCRTRAGTASLCGYDEFGTPSTPPRKFRRLKINTNTDFATCAFADSNACADPACPSDYSFACPWGGSGGHMEGTLTNNGAGGTPGTTSYTASCSSSQPNPPGPPIVLDCQIRINTAGGQTRFEDGDTKDVPNQTTVIFGWTPFGIGDTTCNVICFTVGSFAVHTTKDHWDFVGEYVRDPTPCASACILNQTNNCLRVQSDGNTCPTSGGTGATFPSLDPEVAYAGGSVTTITNNTTKRTDGLGCVASGATSTSFNGTVNQNLDEEDTEQDAIDRATVCQAWGAAGNCTPEDSGTAFIVRDSGFGVSYRECQVRGEATVIVGHNYEMTIGIYARIEGSGGPFVSTGQTIVINFTADVPHEITGWMDVPCEVGFESKAQTCALVDMGT